MTIYGKLFGAVGLFAASAASPGVVLAQDFDPDEEEMLLEELDAFDDAGAEDLAPPPAPALPDNVEEVRTADGALVTPYIEEQRCDGADCDAVVVNGDTGEIAYAWGEWATGYMATRDGEQVVRVFDLSEDVSADQ